MGEEEKKPLFKKGMKVTCVRHGVGVVEDVLEEHGFVAGVKRRPFRSLRRLLRLGLGGNREVIEPTSA